MANTKRKRKASFGVLFWIAVILLFLVVFIATKPRIQRVVQDTGLMTVLHDKFGTPKAGPSSGVETKSVIIGDAKPLATATNPPKAGPQPKFRSVPGLGGGSSTESETQPAEANRITTQPPASQPQSTITVSPQNVQSSKVPDTQPATSIVVSAPSAAAPNVGTTASTPSTVPYHIRASKLYFTLVTEDGKILPEAVTRDVRYVDSPLTDTIRALLKGPTAEELNKGLLNLIPQNTRLLSAYIQNGIAYLNFNDAFEFNPMGVEGFVAQLQQIVHTAIEFPSVSRVQFLINGKKMNYLGGEGIYIGKPIGPDSFS